MGCLAAYPLCVVVALSPLATPAAHSCHASTKLSELASTAVDVVELDGLLAEYRRSGRFGIIADCMIACSTAGSGIAAKHENHPEGEQGEVIFLGSRREPVLF